MQQASGKSGNCFSWGPGCGRICGVQWDGSSGPQPRDSSGLKGSWSIWSKRGWISAHGKSAYPGGVSQGDLQLSRSLAWGMVQPPTPGSLELVDGVVEDLRNSDAWGGVVDSVGLELPAEIATGYITLLCLILRDVT